MHQPCYMGTALPSRPWEPALPKQGALQLRAASLNTHDPQGAPASPEKDGTASTQSKENNTLRSLPYKWRSNKGAKDFREKKHYGSATGSQLAIRWSFPGFLHDRGVCQLLCLDLKCPPQVHVLKAWRQPCLYGEAVEPGGDGA